MSNDFIIDERFGQFDIEEAIELLKKLKLDFESQIIKPMTCRICGTTSPANGFYPLWSHCYTEDGVPMFESSVFCNDCEKEMRKGISDNAQ